MNKLDYFLPNHSINSSTIAQLLNTDGKWRWCLVVMALISLNEWIASAAQIESTLAKNKNIEFKGKSREKEEKQSHSNTHTISLAVLIRQISPQWLWCGVCVCVVALVRAADPSLLIRSIKSEVKEKKM